MLPAPDELRAHYDSLNDEALLAAAKTRDQLLPDAEQIIVTELAHRGLPLPSIENAASTDVQSAPPWVTVARFRDLSSAIVARGALEAAGLPCFLRDENTVRLDWQISNFIGGMRLQVHAEDEGVARAVLSSVMGADEGAVDAPVELQAGERCPFCASSDVHRIDPGLGLRAAVLWLFALPLPRGRRAWHCEECGKNFPGEDLVEVD